ncbi:penicillin-binding transpeptidase domain-containing protein [Methylocella sp.]|uniref:penicillin-binding transpeptidase domain-containing protein n=1 Tax=Methylocella sp. TaxID=1978226 RepID=UPI0037849E4D
MTRAWLGSSLRISPDGQARFLRALLALRRPASPQAQRLALEIVPAFAAAGGWRVRGKTGAAETRGGTFGWFVGWADRDGRRVVFARLVRGEPSSAAAAAAEARDGLLAKLATLAETAEAPAPARAP